MRMNEALVNGEPFDAGTICLPGDAVNEDVGRLLVGPVRPLVMPRRLRSLSPESRQIPPQRRYVPTISSIHVKTYHYRVYEGDDREPNDIQRQEYARVCHKAIHGGRDENFELLRGQVCDCDPADEKLRD
jgi:hypothetical protein